MKYKLIFFYCVCTLTLYAQTPVQTLQDLVNKKQFAKAITMADSLAKQQEPDYATLSATGQAYEGLLRYKEAYQCYMRSLQMDSTNIDALNSVARAAMLIPTQHKRTGTVSSAISISKVLHSVALLISRPIPMSTTNQ